MKNSLETKLIPVNLEFLQGFPIWIMKGHDHSQGHGQS